MHVKSSYPELPPCLDTNASFIHLQGQHQAQWPNFTLILDPQTGEKRTFHDFIPRVQYAATALATPTSQGGLGLSSDNRDLIGIMSKNCADYITFVHACLYIATPFVLISSLSKPFELRHAIKLSKPTCLFVDDKSLTTVLPIAKEFGISSQRIFILSGYTSGLKSLSELIDQTRARAAEIIPVRPARKDTLAYLIFSSGTTGLPKAVMISHGCIIANTCQFTILEQIARKLSTPPTLSTPDGIPRTLAFLPMHHAFGLFAYCFRPLRSPQTLIMMSQWNADLALSLIPKYKITHLTLVPAIVHQLMHHPKTAKTDFSSVVSFHYGAAYLPPKLHEKLKTIAPAQGEGYGMSESTAGAFFRLPSAPLDGTLDHKPRATGKLIPGMEARVLLDDSGAPNGPLAGPNKVGELWLKGPNIALGYLNNEEATKKTFVDGWLRTGDRFSVNEDGYFYFADRVKDTLKVSGIQVSPVEIENVLLAHPQNVVQDVAVAGVSGGRTSDEKVPRAWVVLSAEGQKLGGGKVVKALDDWHKENLSKHKWLRGGIEIVKQIPKSPTGKVLKRELQERYDKGVASAKVKL